MLINQNVGKEADQRPLNPRPAIEEDENEERQEEDGYEEEGEGSARQRFKPIDAGEREIEKKRAAQQKQYDGQRKGCHQTYYFLDGVKLQVLALKPDVILYGLHQLRDGLYILVAT